MFITIQFIGNYLKLTFGSREEGIVFYIRKDVILDDFERFQTKLDFQTTFQDNFSILLYYADFIFEKNKCLKNRLGIFTMTQNDVDTHIKNSFTSDKNVYDILGENKIEEMLCNINKIKYITIL